MHPSYTKGSFNYDLAILTLTERITLGPAVDVIHISKEEPKDGSTMLVTGWGKSAPEIPSSEALLRAELIKWNQSRCVQTWTQDGGQPVTDSMFCGDSVKQSSCKVTRIELFQFSLDSKF